MFKGLYDEDCQYLLGRIDTSNIVYRAKQGNYGFFKKYKSY